MEFDDALEYIQSSYVSEEIYANGQHVLVVQLPENLHEVSQEQAETFFECSKLLNTVTVAYAHQLESNISKYVLEVFDLVFTDSYSPHQSTVEVPDLGDAVSEIEESVKKNPHASIMLTQLLRQRSYLNVPSGLISESLVYATLQGGPEFQTWLSERGSSQQQDVSFPAVSSEREGSKLNLVLNRPNRANAFSAAMRDELVEQLQLATTDTSIDQITLNGEGSSFCSGGDLNEFGDFDSTSEAHLVRMTRNPAFWMHKLRDRMAVHLKGRCIGAGIELPAFSNEVTADETVSISLPEIQMGLIPGAGGTVSLPRRIGPQRTAYLAISGKSIDSQTALDWKLIDSVVPSS